MRIFVTGATGFVGSAVVQDLLAAGHEVIGLARSEGAAASLTAAGATAHRGSLDDLDSLRRGAAAADGVIHTGFIHDFSKFKESCETDRRVIDALGSALSGSGRPLVVTSATGLLEGRPLATENDAAISGPNPRVASEEAAAALASRGINVSVLRLAPSVHGEGDHGFVPMLIDLARRKGASAYVGDGQNRWPGVHRIDAARLFRLAVEKGSAGARYHAVAEEGIPFREIAEVVGRRLQLPIVSLSHEEANAHFGWLAHFAAMDNPTSSAQTREWLGWHPNQPGLIADVDGPGYFKN
ncbi:MULTISPECIES: SDR family oxidoreductase [Phyllobacteriaceae]|jgi:nucleoside-diphosphate-sugar epimerase|uniref:3-beta hydroxysteroid dehydrogenase n=1 Tax=Mesorhizobium hungaricum TaxID=1566387 RepID=A0A1C2DZC2_9HYPH|nr:MULTISPECIES: SDR family oxidoreductase [Mesorhizobium]MBN9234569.1 SDR family oxidoreductase [Mesorhizobium sp.]MDQ0328951.1 nucleoside-diphosphate-sugar epimerase [Mesorhizobium sp. YL-MeA3-2017]OCX19983.1 3-beta hydroxysteroid dehydrogenase [Mesorhizobium hungaricum]